MQVTSSQIYNQLPIKNIKKIENFDTVFDCLLRFLLSYCISCTNKRIHTNCAYRSYTYHPTTMNSSFIKNSLIFNLSICFLLLFHVSAHIPTARRLNQQFGKGKQVKCNKQQADKYEINQ